MSENTASVAQIISAEFIRRLNQNVMPWVRPWTPSTPPQMPRRVTGDPYRGINKLWLWLMADQLGYSSPYWMTYKQAAQLKARVRKGEHGVPVVFYKHYVATEAGRETGEADVQHKRFRRVYRVFNALQIEGLPEQFYAHPTARPIPSSARRVQIDAFFAALPGCVQHGYHKAYYAPSLDVIRMPEPADFRTYELYASTLSHEYIHWSGHETRLNRDLSGSFGDEAYAAEELVACIGQALLDIELGLPCQHMDDHTAYIQSWITKLRNDPNAILVAAAKAEKAKDYLLTLSGQALHARQDPATPAPQDGLDRAA